MKLSLILFVVVALLVAPHTFLVAPVSAQREAAQADGRRHLILCVDGVGFSMIEEMRREGHFKIFNQPSRMIAPFPTLTNVSMTEILRPAGADETTGYEDSFYDTGKNRLRGGLLDRFNDRSFIHGTFRELFDYHPSALKSGLGYAAPPASTYIEALSDLLRLRQKFNNSKEPTYFAYTGASDSLAHVGGARLVRSFLARLDDTLGRIIRDGAWQIDVTVFSDHGNHFRKYRRAELKHALERANFRLEPELRNERSVVLPQFGLVGCAVLFTRETNEPALAASLINVRGVDFAAYEKSGIVYVVNRKGEARIEERDARLRYVAERGDPLELSSVIEQLKANRKADTDGFATGEDWFEATQNNPRIDAVRRIYEGLTAHVRNRANVIVNLEDGYYTGSRTLDVFTFLQATHGNIGQEQSSGFVMSTKENLPSSIRAADLWRIIGSPRLHKSLTEAHQRD
ncbi:MAG: hypothetical protein H0V88_03315 [Pyrinomonadaceae bacterium]|nr:hypothetical protein [Pyrinomonadaceae bacterium]